MKRNNKSGFTLLEIIIVIIIVGVLASLALPKFFSTVEFSKSTEALNNISAVRDSMERCYLSTVSYTSCTDLTKLDVANPTNTPGARFSYAATTASPTDYTITATRLTSDGGKAGDTIVLTQASAAAAARSGTAAFLGIK